MLEYQQVIKHYDCYFSLGKRWAGKHVISLYLGLLITVDLVDQVDIILIQTYNGYHDDNDGVFFTISKSYC